MLVSVLCAQAQRGIDSHSLRGGHSTKHHLRQKMLARICEHFLRPGISEKAEHQGTGTASESFPRASCAHTKENMATCANEVAGALATHVLICSVPTSRYQRATPQGPLPEVALQRRVPDTGWAPLFPSQAYSLYLELHSLPGKPRNAKIKYKGGCADSRRGALLHRR